MEKIEINGFLSIDHAHLEIKKINILIGAQAQGKSVIAKLVYFFKRFFPTIFMASVKTKKPKEDADKNCLAHFEKIFPRYTWDNQVFSITYHYENYHVSIKNTQENNRFSLSFTYSKQLNIYQKEFKQAYQQAADYAYSLNFETNDTLNPSDIIDGLFEQSIQSKIPNSLLPHTSIFIPAGRSFFANLQKNIFSFLSNDIDIDPLIKEFGSRYAAAKRFNQSNALKKTSNTEKIAQLVNAITKGEYLYADEQDWIVNNGKKTNLAHSSSGQQESLPMLLILKTWPFLPQQKKNNTFFIEEPEAHLFPSSQKQIISLIATIYNATDHAFFITTHSPYILTALNNLVAGQDAYHKAKNQNDMAALNELALVLPTDELISLENISAYTLNNGRLESIIDPENRLIGANLLDAVSDEFDHAFDIATNILYGEG